jgi:hypothetical protein
MGLKHRGFLVIFVKKTNKRMVKYKDSKNRSIKKFEKSLEKNERLGFCGVLGGNQAKDKK